MNTDEVSERIFVDSIGKPETYVSGSKVDVHISSEGPQKSVNSAKKTDYWLMIIVAIIMISLAYYGMATHVKLF